MKTSFLEGKLIQANKMEFMIIFPKIMIKAE
jgi:hypothetical protein